MRKTATAATITAKNVMLSDELAAIGDAGPVVDWLKASKEREPVAVGVRDVLEAVKALEEEGSVCGLKSANQSVNSQTRYEEELLWQVTLGVSKEIKAVAFMNIEQNVWGGRFVNWARNSSPPTMEQTLPPDSTRH